MWTTRFVITFMCRRRRMRSWMSNEAVAPKVNRMGLSSICRSWAPNIVFLVRRKLHLRRRAADLFPWITVKIANLKKSAQSHSSPSVQIRKTLKSSKITLKTSISWRHSRNRTWQPHILKLSKTSHNMVRVSIWTIHSRLSSRSSTNTERALSKLNSWWIWCSNSRKISKSCMTTWRTACSASTTSKISHTTLLRWCRSQSWWRCTTSRARACHRK